MSKHTTYFPLFMDMGGKTLLFVGGGQVAGRRIQALLSVLGETSKEKLSGKLQITVVSPKAGEIVEEYAAKGYVLWKKREFQPQDVDGADFVIAVSNCRKTNKGVVDLCRQKGIPVNDGGDKGNCDFYFPAIAVNGNLVAGITASGEDHSLTKKAAQAVRKLLEEFSDARVK